MKKHNRFSALLVLAIVSALLTGCLGGGKDPVADRTKSKEEIKTLYEKHLKSIEVDIEGYTDIFHYPLEIGLAGEEPFYVAKDAEALADLLAYGLGWTKYNGYIRVARTEPEIVVATDNKYASLTVQETWWHEKDDEGIGWSTQYFELQRFNGEWLFTSFSKTLTAYLHEFFEEGDSDLIAERKLAHEEIIALHAKHLELLEIDAEAYADLFHFPLSAYFSVDDEFLVKEIADAEELSILLVENNGWPTDRSSRLVAAGEHKVFFESDSLSATIWGQEYWKSFNDEHPDSEPQNIYYWVVKDDDKWLFDHLVFVIMAKN